MAVTVLLNLLAMPIKLPSKYLYYALSLLVLSTSEKHLFAFGGGVAETPYTAKVMSHLTVGYSAINGTSVSLHQGSGTITEGHIGRMSES